MDKALQKYVRKFGKLNQGTTKYGPAPHKPVLLLAVMQGMEEGWISQNRIELSPELVGTFKAIWSGLVKTDHSPIIAQPFFHMRGEKFWHLVPNPGYEKWGSATKNCKAIGVLHRAVAHIQLDPDLYMLLMSPAHREILKHTLLETYFPNAEVASLTSSSYLNQVTGQILSESSVAYQSEMQLLQDKLDKEGYEEEVFVRGGVFKRQIPLLYNNTCCISGLQVVTNINASLIDACHIVPFSQSHDDTITNGLALCPTLHRAFDRGLVAINPDGYRVMVSKRLAEPVTSTYSICQFEGKKIKRPDNEKYHPGKDNLYRHLERFAENF